MAAHHARHRCCFYLVVYGVNIRTGVEDSDVTQTDERVKVYGADWCGVTRMTLKHLDGLGVPYKYINVDEDPQSSAWVKEQNDGDEVKPTLDIEGEVLSAPRDYLLDDALRRHGILS